MIGATPEPGGTRFEVWAPDTDRVSVVTSDARFDLAPTDDGYHRGLVPGVGHGDRYRLSLDGAPALPDPASRHQPDGVAGPSAVVDPATWTWTDTDWAGPEPDGNIVYECHIGTLTPDGTFDAAIGVLAHLAGLGVTIVELMPVAQFPGTANWGYDGVFPWAVQHSYGGPDGLARFVDAAHGHGLAVIVDVVYNHLGPEGNVLPRFGPYLTDRHHTPWGEAINLDTPGSDHVRAYFTGSAVALVRDHHIDGFRLDAVHELHDHTARTFLEELAGTVRATAAGLGRRVWISAENAANDPRIVRSPCCGGLGYDAVWNDDVHHSLRVALTGDRAGYYRDYHGVADLAVALRDGYALNGRYSPTRGRRHGRPAPDVDPQRFVVFSTNHDHIGNRALGDRLDAVVDDERRAVAAAFVLLSPFTPLLFQGEEHGDRAPFPYFVDHASPDLIEAVRQGRRAEFAGHGWVGDVPDPADPATRAGAVIDFAATDARSERFRRLYRDLVELRRDLPELWATGTVRVVEAGAATLALTSTGRNGRRVSVLHRFAATGDTARLPGTGWRVRWRTTDGWVDGDQAGRDEAGGDEAGTPVWLAPWSTTVAVTGPGPEPAAT